MITRTMLLAPLFAALATAGCAVNGPNDALTGTWTNTSCFGATAMPADIQSCSITLAFGADLSVAMTDARQSQPATAQWPRCTTTRRVTGQQYSTSNGATNSNTMTITGSSTSTMERTGCANAADNSPPAADSVDSIAPGELNYEISANVLTIPTGPFAGHYSRGIL